MIAIRKLPINAIAQIFGITYAEAEKRIKKAVPKDIRRNTPVAGYKRKCQKCSKKFEAAHSDALYCSIKCKNRDVYLKRKLSRKVS
jgi:hypothetical protein